MLPSQGAVRCPEERTLPGQTRLPSADPRWFARTLLVLTVVACAGTVAACACNPYHHGFEPVRHEGDTANLRAVARGHGYSEPRRHADFRICQPDAALLVPQPPPDCEFKGAGNKVVDPDELARLKIEYERQCYQKAEKAARDRLSLLQASSACAIEPASHR